MTYGPGEFRMRNGGKAVVTDECYQLTFPLVGYSDDRRLSWRRNGKRHNDGGQSEYDLVAPWKEPAPDPIDTEMQAWLAEVEAGLEGVTPGVWEQHDENIGLYIEGRYGWNEVCTAGEIREHPHETIANADHIARTNPKRMAALIEFLKRRGVI